jgi:hypothetical protein
MTILDGGFLAATKRRPELKKKPQANPNPKVSSLLALRQGGNPTGVKKTAMIPLTLREKQKVKGAAEALLPLTLREKKKVTFSNIVAQKSTSKKQLDNWTLKHKPKNTNVEALKESRIKNQEKRLKQSKNQKLNNEIKKKAAKDKQASINNYMTRYKQTALKEKLYANEIQKRKNRSKLDKEASVKEKAQAQQAKAQQAQQAKAQQAQQAQQAREQQVQEQRAKAQQAQQAREQQVQEQRAKAQQAREQQAQAQQAREQQVQEQRAQAQQAREQQVQAQQARAQQAREQQAQAQQAREQQVQEQRAQAQQAREQQVQAQQARAQQAREQQVRVQQERAQARAQAQEAKAQERVANNQAKVEERFSKNEEVNWSKENVPFKNKKNDQTETLPETSAYVQQQNDNNILQEKCRTEKLIPMIAFYILICSLLFVTGVLDPQKGFGLKLLIFNLVMLFMFTVSVMMRPNYTFIGGCI